MSLDEDMRRISLAANIECNRQMRERAGMSYEHDVYGVKVPSEMCAAFAYAYQERFGAVPGGIAVGLAGVVKWQAEQAAARENSPKEQV